MTYSTTPPNDQELASLTIHASNLLNHAGDLLRAGMHSHQRFTKSDSSDLTNIDLAVNDFIIRGLGQDSFPSYQILSEESVSTITDLDAPTWVLDPIDGTFPFTAHIGAATIALALVVKGRPVLALVLDPWTDSLYVASTISPSKRNSAPIFTSSTTSLQGARIGIAASGLYEPLKAAGARCINFSASIRLGASVADGGLDALCFGPSTPWDIAPSLLLVPRAGGVVIPLTSTPRLHAARTTGPVILSATPQLASSIAAVWQPLLALGSTPPTTLRDVAFEVHYSAPDNEFVATSAQFPSLSWLDASPSAALSGLSALLEDVLLDNTRPSSQ